MGCMEEIRSLLLDGDFPKDVIGKGYANSTVYAVSRKLKTTGFGLPGTIPRDEILELKQRVARIEAEAATWSKFHAASGMKHVQLEITPILLSARKAAQREWGWRADMPLENFIDTCLARFFEDRGIDLKE